MLLSMCIEPVIDPLLPSEQAGFRHRRSTVDQVTLLNQEIEDTFLAEKKPALCLSQHTTACNTVWHRGLTCRLLHLLSDRNMVSLIMELVRNRRFPLTTSTGK